MSGMDKISNLPDSVLCRILSFLPTKVAVQTTVLSKRWNGLWLSVPTLEFEEDVEADVMRYRDFSCMVYSVLVQRDDAPVEKFILKFSHCSLCCDHNVNTWVKAVLKRGAHHLDLRLDFVKRLPSAIIGSRMLVVLKLASLSVSTIATNSFPSLRVLHLSEVYFSDDQCLTHLLFGCPILEELSVNRLTVVSASCDYTLTGVDAEFQSLKNLVNVVLLFCRAYIPLNWVCRVKSLRMYEEFSSGYAYRCTFPNLTSLVLLVNHYDWSWLMEEVLRNCPILQHFEIHHRVISNNCPADCETWTEPLFVPACISIHLKTCTVRDYKELECELHFSKYILQNAEELRIMRICSGIFSNPEEKLEVRRKLSVFPQRSAECEIHLNEC